MQHHAYQEPYPPGPQDIARLTRLIQRGGIIDDVMADCPAVGELAGAGVLTAFRRRGIASAISAYLARTASHPGIGLIFLAAEPEQEQIYRSTGFTGAATRIWASIRSDHPV